ncbi:MAG: xanthan lyase, partial [Candidatus Omnitrophota bacterium]|nr:xanthan lyase [Candidatus Omnitrophota bacterium]
YGTNYQYRFAGTGTNKFTWLPTITTSGTYEVFARWTSYSNRATNAKYTITNHTGSSAPVEVNQQANNGVWMSLGKHSFQAGGTAQISLSDNANGIVIADAVKLTQQ